MKDKKIVAFIAKSATGKSTISLALTNKLMFMYYHLIHFVKSFTTRAERVYDSNDKNTHIFIDDTYFNDVSDSIIALYESPKGYRSFTTPDSFEDNKINIYTIDPIAYTEMKDSVPNMIGIYFDLDEDERMNRYISREGSLNGFCSEEHLDKKHIPDGMCHIINITNKTTQEIVHEIEKIFIMEGIV